MNAQEIEKRIKENFPTSDVVAIDERGSGDYWDVRIAAKEFDGLSRVKQHQTVMSMFDAELKSGEIHAFTLKTITK